MGEYGGFGGGGGFVEGAQDYGGSPGGGGKKSSKQDFAAKTLIPITLRKLSEAVPDASGDGWRIDSRMLSSVRVIGALREDIADGDAAARLALELHDGSAAATVSYFPDPDDVTWANTRATLRRGDYVDVVLSVKPGSGGALMLNVLSIKKVTDGNAVTHHLLASLMAQLESKHGPLQPVGDAGAGGGYGGAGAAAGGFGGGFGGGGGGGFGTTAAPISAPSGAAAMDAKNSAVMEAFRAEGEASEDGASIDAVANRLRGQGITRADVQRIVEFLTMEGFIYSTIDEEHFKATS